MATEHDAQIFDLVIRGGTIITADTKQQTDLGIRDGVISQIGGPMRGARVIDAADKLVLPGGIDAHVHLTLSDPPDVLPHWCDDWRSGTRAAAAGGVTTVGNMTFPRPGESMVAAVEREGAKARREALIDVMLHPVFTDPAIQPLSDIPALARLGHTSLKYFMSFGAFARNPDPFLTATRIAADNGMITLVHCEDAAMIANATVRLVATDRAELSNYHRSRPVAAEASATARAIAFAELTGAPTYIVHLSSRAALEEVQLGRGRGAPVSVETRPIYLYQTEERYAATDAGKYVVQPPLRTKHDQRALWRGLTNGVIDTVCTDHAPWKLADKVAPGLDVRTVRPGLAELDTFMPTLYSEGVVKHKISIHRFVEVTATNAAKLFGLFPRKGTIAVGSDADLVIWDPRRTKPVRAADFFTNADYSVYEGKPVTGWPAMTISRGDIVFADGRIVAEAGRGQVLQRGETQLL